MPMAPSERNELECFVVDAVFEELSSSSLPWVMFIAEDGRELEDESVERMEG